jgi:hypothetical protein
MLGPCKSKGKWKVVDLLESLKIRSRKPKQANWEKFEIIALINAKKSKYEANLEVVDLQNDMETSVKKWRRILKIVINNGCYEHHLNIPTCKDKWGSFYGDYKKEHNYTSGTKHNEEYWDMFVEEKIIQGLPKNFRKMSFEFINSFMNKKSCKIL